jgi:putative lipoic acid-binding regulatory protein
MSKDIKDGYDLIEYPHDFVFKAMCRAGNDSQLSLSKIVTDLVSSERLIKTVTKQSKTAKYESISLTVSLQNRTELEAIYQAIAAHPSVVMTL